MFCCDGFSVSTDPQLTGHEAAGGCRSQNLHSERLLQRNHVPVPDQVSFRAGDQGGRRVLHQDPNWSFHEEQQSVPRKMTISQ